MKAPSVPDADELLAAVRAEGIRDSRLLAAISDSPRAEFVPSALVPRAYLDAPLPIGHEQVLEVRTGFGWQTTLLGRLAAHVWSIERWPDLAEEARTRLRRARIENVEIVIGDGTEGLPDHAPYDAIIVSAAFTSVPDAIAF